MDKKEFIWTDDMVREIVANAHKDGFQGKFLKLHDRVEQFKKYKQVEDRIEVTVSFNAASRQDLLVWVNKNISHDKLPLIKEAIESVLNKSWYDTASTKAAREWDDTYSEILLKGNPPFNEPTNSINKEEDKSEITFTLQEVERVFNYAREVIPFDERIHTCI